MDDAIALKLASFFRYVWHRLGSDAGEHALADDDVLMAAAVACGLASWQTATEFEAERMGAKIGDRVLLPTDAGLVALDAVARGSDSPT